MTDLTGALLPTLDWGEVFHVGIRVTDMEAAQQELAESLGLSWTVPATMPLKVWAPGAGYSRGELTISFSTVGPVRIEVPRDRRSSFEPAKSRSCTVSGAPCWILRGTPTSAGW